MTGTSLMLYAHLAKIEVDFTLLVIWKHPSTVRGGVGSSDLLVLPRCVNAMGRAWDEKSKM